MTEKTYIDGIPTEDYGKPWSKSFYPEFQQTENGCKVSVPVFTNLELKELDYNIQTHYNEVIEQISKTVSRDREIIVLKKIIQKQDTEINKLNNVIDELVGEVEVLNYETIGKWCNKDKGDKCKNCDTNNHDCIKEYFINNK